MKKIVNLLLITALLGCTQNLFEEMVDQDSPEAVFFQAKREINKRNYSAAIILLQSLDPLYMSERSRIPIYASAYAGRCGLEFISLLEELQATTSSAIFAMLMGSFPGALAANVQDCIEASDLLQGIGDEIERNGDENLLLAFTSLAKIGTILSSLADTDDDGVADATFDQCDNTDLPDDMVREVGAGLAVTLLSLSGVGAGYIDGAVDSFTDLCSQDPSLASFCSVTDPASFSPAEVQAFRYAIGSNDYGIDSCGGQDISNCAASNPLCP